MAVVQGAGSVSVTPATTKARPATKPQYSSTKGTTAAANFWPLSKGDPNKKNPAPPGWDWVPAYNGEQFIGYALKRDKDEDDPSGPGGGGGGGGGYGYGGYSTAKAGLSQYIQRYRVMFNNTSIMPPKWMLKKAEAGNWSGTYWDMMVRLKDPKYFRSAEAKKRLADLNSYWKAVLPGTKLNRGFAKDYLRHGWTNTQLQNEIMRRPEARKQYPFWKQFVKAQREAGRAKNVNPLGYKQLAEGFNSVYKEAGEPEPVGYEKLFFKSGLTDDEFLKNYQMLAQTRAATVWDIGGLSEQQKRAGLFDGKGATPVKGLLQTALNKQQGFMQAKFNPFRVAEEDSLVTMRGI